MNNKKKTNVELLASFKKMNLIARERHAIKKGFTTSADYMSYLSGAITFVPKEKAKTKAKAKNVTIYIVDILDKSGSMSGSKLSAALESINAGVGQLRGEPYDYKYSLCTFSSPSDIEMPYITDELSAVKSLKIAARGGTALYDAIGYSLTTVGQRVPKNAKVLVNIYTDGEENCSHKFSKEKIAAMISKYQEIGFTITFIGTHHDTETVIKELNIDESNTLKYDGTAKGLKISMMSTNSCRSSYSAAVMDGMDVSKGFYKNIKK